MSLVELYITHLEKNGTLLKVYGQVDQNSAEFLEKIIYQYTDLFERLKIGEPKAAKDIYPGLICCARYKDNKYYRAEVKSVVQLAPGYVSVFFIDYGNTDRVKLSDIRLLDDVGEPTFSNLHRLATEYYLAGVRPVTSEWDEHTLNFVEEAIRYRTVKCAIMGEVIGKKLLKIFWGESDISSYLIGMGAAVYVTQEVQEILIETSSGVVPTRYSVPPPAPVATPAIQSQPVSVPPLSSYQSLSMRGPSQGGIQVPFSAMMTRPTLPAAQPGRAMPAIPVRPLHPAAMVSGPPPTLVPPQPFSVPVPTQGKSQQFASEMLPENSEHAVYVSHVEEGPLSFAVQLKAVAEHALTELMAELNEHDPVPISRPLLPGSICLGRFSEDQSLCRAVVMHVMNDKCRLYYPDYGNSEVLPCTHIYDMPLQFIEVKVMALRFTLAGFKNVKVTQEMKDIFKDIVTDKELMMKVAPTEENKTKQYCELYLNGRNVRELMKEKLAKLILEYPKLHVPPRGSMEKVIVSYVESPTRIVVQLEVNQETLNTVMSCVAAHCRDNPKITLKASHLKVNMPVCAFYPVDSTWYRALIKEFNETEATVLFVDYGNEDVVPLTSLKRISSDLVTKVRIQALECCLAGFELSQSDQEIADRLFNIINEKTLTMHVLDVMKNQVLIVHLLDEHNINVGSYLKQVPVVSAPPPQVQRVHSVIQSSPPVASTDDNDWVEEPEIRHPSKTARDNFQPGSGRNDNQGGNRFNDDSGGKNWRTNNREDSYQPREKHDRFSNDDAVGKNWRSNSREDSFQPREKSDRFSRDDRKSGKWNKDDGGDNKSSWRNEDRSPRKWDRSGDGDGSDDKFNKRWDNKDRNSDRGGGKWDRSGDSEDGKFKKWDRDENRNSDSGGFNKWNKDNDRGGKSFGDGPRKFEDRKPFGKSSDDGWDSKPKRDDFGSRGGSKYEPRKTSYNRQSSSGGSGSTPVPPKKVLVPYPEVSVGEKEVVEIVYSISPAEFFVQLARYKDELTNLMSTIASNYVTDGAALTSPEKGMYCVAMYAEDEVWYRAVIDSVTDTTANVLFIDYGNSEEVPLDKLKVMTPDISTLSAQAVKCGLLSVAPRANNAWSDEEQTEFAVATEGKTLQADLKCKTFANDIFQIVLKDITEGEDGAPIINTLFNATEESLNAVVPVDSCFQLYPLTVGQSIEIQVTWFISPSSFYVQPLNSNAEFREMMEHIQEHVRSFKHVSPFDIKVGKNLIARFKEDKILYRAEIKETGFLGPLVNFVDYGNSETVEKNQLYEVKPEYNLMPCQAIACSLASVKPSVEEWPKLGSSNIENFFEADSYKCTVLAEGENGIFIVSLNNQDGTDVSQQLIDNGFAVSDGISYTTPSEEAYTTVQLSLLADQILFAHVTCVENSKQFFVQLLPLEAAKLQQELDAVTAVPDNLKIVEPDNLNENILCISSVDGTSWQRASVINKTGTSGPVVRFIDTGVSAEVSNDKVVELPNEFVSIPSQAFECTLSADEVEEGEFKSSVLDKDVLLLVEAIDSERLRVAVYSSEGALLKILEEETDKPKAVDVVCPMPVLKKQDRLVISHAESGAIFVQRVADIENLKLLLGELYDWCEEIAACELEWQVGALCCAKSAADDQWYRAKILTIEPEINVKYLDYGNCEVVALDRLRKLESQFFKPEAFALEVKMAVSWQVSEEHLLELVPEKEFNATIIKWQESWYVEFIDDNNENLSSKLIELGFATEIENSPFIKKVSSISKISVGSKVGVCRSHICSPSQFWVILNEDFEDLEHLQDRLQNSVTSMKAITGTPPKSMIAAKFSDGIWYRAVYLAADKSVFSVDYGNTESSTGEHKELSEDFLMPDGYAILCTLNVGPVEGEWNQEAIELFDSLIPDDVIVAHVFKMDEIVTVDVKVNDESVSKTLIDKGFAVKTILTSSVYVSHVNSVSDFYVQEENPLLEQIRENLTLSDKFYAIEDIGSTEQKIFAAQYNVDGLWYRAKLLSSDENGHLVLFVDYGNSDVATEFKELPNELLEFPLMAKNCSLKLPESVDSWTDEACDKFIELGADGSTLFDIKFLTDDEPALVEMSMNGQSVGDLLSHSEVVPVTADAVNVEDDEGVVVSHINNPNDFWIQSENAPLEDLANYFADVENWAVISAEDVTPDQLVAALFNDDCQWYRAKVLGKTDDSLVNVLFIDYGNTSMSNELRQLPEESLQLPPAAKHCCMEFSCNVTEWPTEAIDHFKELTGHGTEVLKMKYITSGEPSVVRLFIGEEDIAPKLSDLCSKKGDVGVVVDESETSQTINICHINSPADFYIHTDKIKVDEITNSMAEGDNFEPISEVVTGKMVAARFVDDGLWYRATVTRSLDNSYDVFFVDYGNTATATELKSLPQNLLDVPYLAQLCSLQTVGDSEDWTETALDKFFEISADGTTDFGLKIVSEGFPTVVELIYDGQPVSLLLLETETVDQNNIEDKADVQEDDKTNSAEESDGTKKDEIKCENGEDNDKTELVEVSCEKDDGIELSEENEKDEVVEQTDEIKLDVVSESEATASSNTDLSIVDSKGPPDAQNQKTTSAEKVIVNDNVIEKKIDGSLANEQYQEGKSVEKMIVNDIAIEEEIDESLADALYQENKSVEKIVAGDSLIEEQIDESLPGTQNQDSTAAEKQSTDSNVIKEISNVPDLVGVSCVEENFAESDIKEENIDKYEIKIGVDLIKGFNTKATVNDKIKPEESGRDKIDVEMENQTVINDNSEIKSSNSSPSVVENNDSSNGNANGCFDSPVKDEDLSASVEKDSATIKSKSCAKNLTPDFNSHSTDEVLTDNTSVEENKTINEPLSTAADNTNSNHEEIIDKTDVKRSNAIHLKTPFNERIVPGPISHGSSLVMGDSDSADK